jgi:hypothetical protein
MIQHILEKLVGDHEVALWWHAAYVLSTAGIFTACGMFIAHKPGKPSWQTVLTAVYTVALMLPLLASLASQMDVSVSEAWIDMTWYSIFTTFGFVAVAKDWPRRVSEPRFIRGEFREVGGFDVFYPQACVPYLQALGKGVFSAFFSPRRKEDGYYPDDSNALKAMFSSVSARLGFSKEA